MHLRNQLYLAYLRTPEHPTKLRLARWFRAILRIESVVAQVKVGVMDLCPTDFVQYKILADGSYEPQTLALYTSLIKAGDTVVDVGANVGQYTLAASRHCGENGLVLAIEPNPLIFCRLQRNLSLNQCGNVRPILASVTSSNTLLQFSAPPAWNLGLSRVAITGDTNTFWVSGHPLSEVVQAFRSSNIAVLKIDVEGHEYEVLRGILNEGNCKPRHIILEYLPALFSYGGDPRDLLQYLTTAGYKL